MIINIHYYPVTNHKRNSCSYDNGSDCVFSLSENQYIYLAIIIRKGTTVNSLVFKPQLEEGSAVTEYKKYLNNFSDITLSVANNLSSETQVFEIKDNGSVNGIQCKNEIQLSVNSDRLKIFAEYNKDINKAFSELQALMLDSQN